MGKINRRQFIKISGMGTVGAGLAAANHNARLRRADEYAPVGTDVDEVVPSFCELCFWKCGILAKVREGKIVKLEGHPQHHDVSVDRQPPGGEYAQHPGAGIRASAQQRR